MDPSGKTPSQIVNVSLLDDDSDTSTSYWMIYSHFTLPSLLHDPEFGFVEEDLPEVPFSPIGIPPNQTFIIVAAVLLSTIVAITMVVVWFSLRKKYDYLTLD